MTDSRWAARRTRAAARLATAWNALLAALVTGRADPPVRDPEGPERGPVAEALPDAALAVILAIGTYLQVRGANQSLREPLPL